MSCYVQYQSTVNNILNLKYYIQKEYKMSSRKSYQSLIEEREAILDEVENWKHNKSNCQNIGLWNNSTYLDELLYIKQIIEKEMIQHEIVFRMKFFVKLGDKLPKELIYHITSFGDIVDKSAAYFIENNIPFTTENINPTTFGHITS